LRLNRSFRYSVYAIFALLLVSGAGWFAADWQKGAPGDDIWQQFAANMLMLHGGAAMLALLALGALLPLHLLRAWRVGKNRVSGSFVAGFNAVLVLTAFGLYYLGSDVVRPWMSWIHIAAGLAISTMLPLHIMLGRRRAEAEARDADPVTPAQEMTPGREPDEWTQVFRKDRASTIG